MSSTCPNDNYLFKLFILSPLNSTFIICKWANSVYIFILFWTWHCFITYGLPFKLVPKYQRTPDCFFVSKKPKWLVWKAAIWLLCLQINSTMKYKQRLYSSWLENATIRHFFNDTSQHSLCLTVETLTISLILLSCLLIAKQQILNTQKVKVTLSLQQRTSGKKNNIKLMQESQNLFIITWNQAIIWIKLKGVKSLHIQNDPFTSSSKYSVQKYNSSSLMLILLLTRLKHPLTGKTNSCSSVLHAYTYQE